MGPAVEMRREGAGGEASYAVPIRQPGGLPPTPNRGSVPLTFQPGSFSSRMFRCSPMCLSFLFINGWMTNEL